MRRGRQEIERAFRSARWRDLVLDLKRSWGMWALVVTLVAGLGYYNATPRTVVEIAHGTAIGAHQPASEDNSALMRIAVRIDSNRIVNVSVPRATPYLVGRRVEIGVIRRDWPPYAVTYRFVRYVEGSP